MKMLYFARKKKAMRYNYLAVLIGLALFATACKSDKAVEDAGPEKVEKKEETAFRDATIRELTGDFVDANYPDKGFWKKFSVEQRPDSMVQVAFTSAEGPNKQAACRFSGIGKYNKGYIKVPVNPGSPNPTYLTIKMITTGDIFVGAEGGDNPNPADVLSLFCMISPATSIGGLYKALPNE
jgi:hypothetical protein